MGKKSNKNKAPKKNLNKLALPLFSLTILVILTGVFFATKQSGNQTPVASATGTLIETRPILSDAFFTGKVAQAYRIAAEIPKVLDSQFCYCYCKQEKKHKTLLTCFTNKHGSKCETCINEVLYAYEMYKKGLTLDEIVIAIDKKFYRPPPHRSL
ncbi:hypothetical protein MNBD_NITROSPINAE05-1311 [hydrothermal vent metagenome]|uniref:Uncharacterized protein n=1 Tax=hydrothermal vent metagenome TaxID=652676 RepID=A0A3B1D5Y4_9ZZZZ